MRPPSFRASSVLLVMLSLSIGWGIRGNYGHEAGAMIPGALAAIAAALMSGREAWRSHIPYFAFFGALGWAFGGSISNMHPPTSVDRLGRQQPPFRTRRRLARQAHPQIQASQLTGYLDV